MKPGHMAIARMAWVPYSTAAALVSAMTPAFAAEYTLTGNGVAFVPPVDDQLTMTLPPVQQHRPNAVFGTEHDPTQVNVHQAVVFLHRDVGERTGEFYAGDVQDSVNTLECVQCRREHRLDLILFRYVASKRHTPRHILFRAPLVSY